jgi:hypothetical protein
MNITYRKSTLPGHCGLPVLSDTILGKSWVGSHKCGNGTLAGAAILFKEWFDLEFKELYKIYPHIKVLSYQDNEVIPSAPNLFAQCYPGVTLGAVKAFHTSDRTKLVKLPHADLFDLKTLPAVLGVTKIDGHWISPYHKNRENMPSIIPVYPDVPDIDPLVSGLINGGLQHHQVSDLALWRRRLTLAESLYGIAGTNFSGIDMTTSVGYDKVLSGRTSKKQWLSDPTFFRQVRDEYYACIAQLERGERPLFFVMDNLKDERLLEEKVFQAKTRVVCAGAFIALLINRTFFGGYSAWTMDNKVDNGSAIGMNPYSIQWDYMCRELLKPHHQCFAGDSGKFDLKEHPHHMRSVFSGINDWYGDPVDNKIRDILSLDFMFARHITPPVHVGPEARGELLAEPLPSSPHDVSTHLKIVNASDCFLVCWVYSANSGHPSGHFLTAVINTDYSRTKPYIVLQWSMKNFKVVLDLARRRLVFVACLGDDFVYSVHAELQHLLNAQIFAAFSLLYGMIVTTESKKPITQPFPDEPLVFLKRALRFDEDHGRYVGPLALPAIIDGMCYMKKKDPSEKDIQLIFDNALSEFTFHGRPVYEYWAPKLQFAARRTLNLPYVSPPWHVALAAASQLEANYRP